jgi:hypothetical protein
MANIIDEQKDEFQIILLEHASRDYWEEPVLEHYHFVEEFRDGNALIPSRFVQNPTNDDK